MKMMDAIRRFFDERDAEQERREAEWINETALTRRAWYLAGRRDERHHARQRTTFPAMPD